jgi:sulfur dioxygenase
VQISARLFRVSSASAASASFLSYCVYDSQSHEAILIDPHLDALQEYTDFLSQNGLRLSLIVETELHFSHPTAAHALSKRFGAPIAMSELTESESCDRKLSSGDRITLGDSEIVAELIPGIRKDSLFLHKKGNSEMVFTGESLWFGVPSAIGLPGSNLEAFSKSISLMKSRIGPESLVFSGYDVRGYIFSTWKNELEKNPDLTAQDLSSLERGKSLIPVRLSEDFLEFARFNSQKTSDDIGFRKTDNLFNLENIGPFSPSYSTISADKLDRKENAFMIDVREKDEFALGHIPGSKNIPLSEVAFHLRELAQEPRIYCACQTGRRSQLVAASLGYVGFKDVVALTGGFQAWQNAGLPSRK